MSRSAVRFQANFYRLVPGLMLAAAFIILLSLPALSAEGQQADKGSQDKHLDIRSSAGDMHLGNDADVRDIGLPVYPGARLRQDDESKNSANVGIFTSAFGIKLVAVHYDSDDAPSKLIAYYREKLKKYGKVLECHTSDHGGGVHVNAGNADSTESHDSPQSKVLKCEGDNTGKDVELKVGTEDNQRIVAVEPAEKGAGSTFALVYLRTRGKQGDI
jgi:hypothetical protein